jgi:hypothetical protein
MEEVQIHAPLAVGPYPLETEREKERGKKYSGRVGENEKS